MASYYICFLFDQYCWQCLLSKTDKQLTFPSFHYCSRCSVERALLKDSLMGNSNCFERHVLLIFHLNSYRSFALPHVPSWPVLLSLHCWFDGCFTTHLLNGFEGELIRKEKEKAKMMLKIDFGR